jgi:hypothetical protein
LTSDSVDDDGQLLQTLHSDDVSCIENGDDVRTALLFDGCECNGDGVSGM